MWQLVSLAVIGISPAAVAVAYTSRDADPSSWLARLAGVLVTANAPAAGWWVMLTAVAVVVVVVTPWWRRARYGVTLVHEMGHAFTAGALGGTPARITVGEDSAGLARWRRTSRWRSAAATAAGYPAGAFVGATAIAAAASGVVWVWWAVAGVSLAATAVLMARNTRAWVVVVCASALVVVVVRVVPAAASVVAIALGVFLMLGSLRTCVELVARDDLTGSDAAGLRTLVWLPARVAAALLTATTVGVALGGVWLTIQVATP